MTSKKSETSKILLSSLLTATFTIVAIFVGSFLTYKYSYTLFIKQKVFENQRICYAKLFSEKIPLGQNMRTMWESRALSEFYEKRYLCLSHNPTDYQEAKKKYDESLTLIKDYSTQIKEVFETIGLIQTYFEQNTELKKAVDDLLNYHLPELKPFPSTFKKQIELDNYYRTTINDINPWINNHLEKKFDTLLSILKKQLF